MDDESTTSPVEEGSNSCSLQASVRISLNQENATYTESNIAIQTEPRAVESPSHDSLQIRDIALSSVVPRVNATPSHSIPKTPVIDRHARVLNDGYTFNWIETYSDFQRLVEHCQSAMAHGIVPDRIGKGSSGSYFIKDMDDNIVGVFKPKDEEPYGRLNPRWIKWLHRHCCPCMFGRSFLMPNTGYISEAAASLVDAFLNLNLVPRTHIAHLSSAAFVFPWWEHYRMWREHAHNPAAQYPLKLGSFQLFVQGFEDAKTVLDKVNLLRPFDPRLREVFQGEFEKMTILDYAIRNTDRSLDNWLIHLTWADEPEEVLPNATSVSAIQSATQVDALSPPAASPFRSDTNLAGPVKYLKPRVKIACIDNGLAFPFKHPHELRSYPYSWATLPEAKIPYSFTLRKNLLSLLTDTANWDLLIGRLKLIFQIDSDFSETIFRKQMAVLRGQLHNIVEALLLEESPAQLLEKPLLLIHEDGEEETPLQPEGSREGRRKHIHTRVKEKPFFTCW